MAMKCDHICAHIGHALIPKVFLRRKGGGKKRDGGVELHLGEKIWKMICPRSHIYIEVRSKVNTQVGGSAILMGMRRAQGRLTRNGVWKAWVTNTRDAGQRRGPSQSPSPSECDPMTTARTSDPGTPDCLSLLYPVPPPRPFVQLTNAAAKGLRPHRLQAACSPPAVWAELLPSVATATTARCTAQQAETWLEQASVHSNCQAALLENISFSRILRIPLPKGTLQQVLVLAF